MQRVRPPEERGASLDEEPASCTLPATARKLSEEAKHRPEHRGRAVPERPGLDRPTGSPSTEHPSDHHRPPGREKRCHLAGNAGHVARRERGGLERKGSSIHCHLSFRPICSRLSLCCQQGSTHQLSDKGVLPLPPACSPASLVRPALATVPCSAPQHRARETVLRVEPFYLRACTSARAHISQIHGGSGVSVFLRDSLTRGPPGRARRGDTEEKTGPHRALA